jgi:hypothetical protein
MDRVDVHVSMRTLLADVRYGSKADISQCNRHVRFTPESEHSAARVACPLWANGEHHGSFLRNKNWDIFGVVRGTS